MCLERGMRTFVGDCIRTQTTRWEGERGGKGYRMHRALLHTHGTPHFIAGFYAMLTIPVCGGGGGVVWCMCEQPFPFQFREWLTKCSQFGGSLRHIF